MVVVHHVPNAVQVASFRLQLSTKLCRGDPETTQNCPSWAATNCKRGTWCLSLPQFPAIVPCWWRMLNPTLSSSRLGGCFTWHVTPLKNFLQCPLGFLWVSFFRSSFNSKGKGGLSCQPRTSESQIQETAIPQSTFTKLHATIVSNLRQGKTP